MKHHEGRAYTDWVVAGLIVLFVLATGRLELAAAGGFFYLVWRWQRHDH